MSVQEDAVNDIRAAIGRRWDVRAGNVVPESDGVALGSAAGVTLDATVLYSDLADSTSLAMSNPAMAARIFKAFLASSSRLIRANGGEIRSFDGDRVMGVFLGDNSDNSAVLSALQINWAFMKVLKPLTDIFSLTVEGRQVRAFSDVQHGAMADNFVRKVLLVAFAFMAIVFLATARHERAKQTTRDHDQQ